MGVEIKHNTLNGKKITYTSQTRFYIQLSTGSKAYKNKHAVKGNLGEAVAIFNSYLVANGHNKRLLMEDKVICRVLTKKG